MTSVFLTGATGYIGGEVLYQLLQHGGFDVSALVRTEAKAALLRSKTDNKVRTVIGCLDDVDLISDEVARADVVINTANVDHVPSAEAMAQALRKKTTKTVFIHTSGTSVLGDALAEAKTASAKVYSDVADIDEILALPALAPHQPVDRIVQGIEEANPLVKVVIVCPLTIFGRSRGYDNLYLSQIPILAKVARQLGHAYTVYSGDYIWSHVHVEDLGDLYLLLLEKLLKGENIPTGRPGYYFGAYTTSDAAGTKPTSIEHTWKGVAQEVGRLLKAKGAIATDEVKPLAPAAIADAAGFDFAPYLWGTNSRSRADNAVQIGWKPKHALEKTFWAAVEDDVDYVLSK